MTQRSTVLPQGRFRARLNLLVCMAHPLGSLNRRGPAGLSGLVIGVFYQADTGKEEKHAQNQGNDGQTDAMTSSAATGEADGSDNKTEDAQYGQDDA